MATVVYLCPILAEGKKVVDPEIVIPAVPTLIHAEEGGVDEIRFLIHDDEVICSVLIQIGGVGRQASHGTRKD